MGKLQSFGYDVSYHNYTWERTPKLSGRVHLDNHVVRIGHFWFPRYRRSSLLPGLGLRLALQRKLTFHMSQTFLPSVILIIVAGISFFVPSDQIPGRLVLCVTTLLTFTSMFNAVRSLTPQVSYMKAVDIWVLACLLFVFSCLAEYGVVLHLTSRAAWQRKVDGLIRQEEGRERLREVSRLQLAFPLPDKQEKQQKLVRGVAVLPPALLAQPVALEKAKKDVGGVKAKERLAYRIEYLAKLVYPASFLAFNLLYWSYYLHLYYASTQLHKI